MTKKQIFLSCGEYCANRKPLVFLHKNRYGSRAVHHTANHLNRLSRVTCHRGIAVFPET